MTQPSPTTPRPRLSPLFLFLFSFFPISHQKNKTKQNNTTWMPSKIFGTPKILKAGYHCIVQYRQRGIETWAVVFFGTFSLQKEDTGLFLLWWRNHSLYSRRTSGNSFCPTLPSTVLAGPFLFSCVCCLLSEWEEHTLETQQLALCQPTVTKRETWAGI